MNVPIPKNLQKEFVAFIDLGIHYIHLNYTGNYTPEEKELIEFLKDWVTKTEERLNKKKS